MDLSNSGHSQDGEHTEEVLDTVTLIEFVGPYSTTANGLRTLGVPNELFGNVAYFLSEVAFVTRSPNIMHRAKEGVIIAAWQDSSIYWGHIMVEALLKEIRAFQTCKRRAPALLDWMGLLFRPENSRE